MIIRVSKTFLEDYNGISDATFQEAFKEVFQLLTTISHLEHPQIKKVAGHDTAFRIGMGFYYIGLYQTSADEVVLMRLVHREQITAVFG